MEKCGDSDYPENQYDSSKSSETWTDLLSINTMGSQKNKSEEPDKVPRARKKIAAENRSLGRSDLREKIANSRGDKSVRESSESVKKLNVLNSRLMSARYSVQNNTKILHRNVPDRLGKYVNSSVRRETKLLLGESIAKPSNDCSQGGGAKSGTESSDVGYLSNDCPDTKLNLIGNECLSNKESVTLGNSIESDSGSKNIFEKIFDDCLGSTSVVNDASSRETLNLETDDESVAINPRTVEKYTRLLENFENFKKDDARMIENEKTPTKKDRGQQQEEEQSAPNAPVKIKDHSNYYSHKKIRHVCGYCHKIFKSNGKLNSHVYSHTGERPFDCSNCGKAFSSKFKLVRHLLIHSEIRKFVCQICDRTFLRNDHLKNHYKIHDPQKKIYKCPKEHCDKEYSSVMSHKKHMAYHSVEDGDLKCLICNVKFETKEEILFHLKSHSGSRLFKSQSDKKFKCDFCDRLFLTRKDVTRHLVVHTGERDFLCQFCPQRFGRKDHLVRHIKKSHASEGMTVKNEVTEEKKAESSKAKAPSPSPTSSKAEEKEEKMEMEEVEEEEVEERGEEEEEGKEESATEEGDRKTHIVITVKNPMQKKKWKSSESSSKSKSFRKSDSSVPNRKQVPLSKNKSSTTQIFLDNIPNILIIPNNSIILLRNKGSSSKAKKATETSESTNNNGSSTSNSGSTSAEAASEDRFQFPDDFLSGERQNPEDSSPPLESDFNLNYNYNLYHQPQFPTGYPYGDAFGGFQPEMTSFDNLNFEMLTQSQGPPKRSYPAAAESDASGGGLISEESTSKGPESQADMNRKVGIVKPMTKSLLAGETPCDMEKDLFEEGAENLMMNDSILNDFKVDDSVILPLENDGGILNNIFGQGGVDVTGNELLRNLLLSENSMLSPLPGFSQIFHNSNTN